MKLLVIGGGGREDALTWKLAQSTEADLIYVAPGNGGTANEKKAVNIPIKADDIDGLLAFALKEKIDFVVVGPEAPLAAGIVDSFNNAGIAVFGPDKAAARIEASKSFAKEIMTAAGIPTAAYQNFTDINEAVSWIKSKGAPVVVKADGLAAGKGVTVAHTVDEAIIAVNDILTNKLFGDAGASVVLEEFLEGEEVSYLVLTDGATIMPLVSAQDHKAVYDGDTGPNTGGMGAYSPAPTFNAEQYEKLSELVAEPVIKELRKRGIVYKGILYAGLMVSGNNGVKVLEYNCRFGDPETQVIIPRMKSDLLKYMCAVSEGRLGSMPAIEWDETPAVCVVMASAGYPGAYETGYPINGIDAANALPCVKVFHSGAVNENGLFITAGGRALSVTATGKNIKNAIDNAYAGVSKINFEGAHFRKDIGNKALKR
ncbi:MAG: phosphoribosylamine--glycine ligase [Deferribacteraceae bacterium]|jgi:phosphoribosylamine--glycine ligase|nr:phosphoribosylamine--glycine ligase [Deferribacteraceae bacterium]